MNDEKKKTTLPFWIQLPPLCLFAIIILWVILTSLSPSAASVRPSVLESAGVFGAFVCFFACVPVGIIGCVFSREKAGRMEKLRIPTKILSIINIVLGAAEILVVVLLLSAIINNMGNFPM